MNWMLDYFRRSADHRLLFGGRVSYSGHRSVRFRARAARAHRARVSATHRIHASNTPGAATSTSRRTARRISGVSAPNVYFLQGLSGHGMVISGIAGKLVTEVIGGICRALRRVCEDPASRLSRRHLSPPSGAGARHAVVPAHGSVVSGVSISNCGSRRCRCCWSPPRSPGCCRCRCATSPSSIRCGA